MTAGWGEVIPDKFCSECKGPEAGLGRRAWEVEWSRAREKEAVAVSDDLLREELGSHSKCCVMAEILSKGMAWSDLPV